MRYLNIIVCRQFPYLPFYQCFIISGVEQGGEGGGRRGKGEWGRGHKGRRWIGPLTTVDKIFTFKLFLFPPKYILYIVDIKRQVHELSTSVYQIRGHIKGKTLLPFPQVRNTRSEDISRGKPSYPPLRLGIPDQGAYQGENPPTLPSG